MTQVGAFEPGSEPAADTADMATRAGFDAAALYTSLSPAQLQKLMTASELIGRGEDAAQIAAVLVREGVAAVHGAKGVVVLVDEEGTHLELVAANGYPWDQLLRWRRVPLNAAAPLAEAVRARQPVVVASVEDFERRYPDIELSDRRPHAVVAVPLFSGSQAIGGWGIRVETSADGGAEQVASATAAGRYLGEFASSSLSHAVDRGALARRVEQLQTALTSRIAIEQAKGVLAERYGMTTEHAFEVLRSHARRHGMRLHRVAAAVVAGEVDPLA